MKKAGEKLASYGHQQSHSTVLLEGCLKLTKRTVTSVLNIFALDVSGINIIYIFFNFANPATKL